MKTAVTILVVDDEQPVRKLVATALHAFGYENVIDTASADRALEITRQHRPSIELLLSDINLGGGTDGVQLAVLIAGMRPEIRVLLMSGQSSRQFDVQPGWQFIPKPFTPPQLHAAVQKTLEAVAVQYRQAVADLTVFTLDLNKKIIPAGATLEDFRVGPGHEGPLSHNPDVVSFHHGGEVLFNVANEIVSKTRLVRAAKHLHAA